MVVMIPLNHLQFHLVKFHILKNEELSQTQNVGTNTWLLLLIDHLVAFSRLQSHSLLCVVEKVPKLSS